MEVYCIHLTPKLFVLVQKKKRKKENWSPDSHPHGIHGCSRQALDISADGSLNRTKSSDASLQFVFTWHKRLLSLVFSLSTVQQAQARFMNAGIKNKKKPSQDYENFFQSGLYCQNRQNISSYLLNNTYRQCKRDCFWKVRLTSFKLCRKYVV